MICPDDIETTEQAVTVNSGVSMSDILDQKL